MTDWPSYLHEFHGERPGITEALLERCTDAHGQGPYRWLTNGVQRPADTAADGSGLVVDLGCGNGPVADHFEQWVGVDVSAAELAQARVRGRGPVVQASAEAMPISSGSASVVLAVMSLMVVDDPAGVLAEAARVLETGGQLAVMLPAQRPLTVRDVIRYGVLLVALGRVAMPFPHRDVSGQLESLLAEAGFTIQRDERQRFGFPMDAPGAADLLVDALYLPDAPPRRIHSAKARARRWGRADMGLALRRVVAIRSAPVSPATPATPATT